MRLFSMSQGLCRGCAVVRTMSLLLSWEAERLAFMLCETAPTPPYQTFLSEPTNEAERGVNQL